KHRAIPLGTGNKTERLFGYFTWHGDDAPPVNPLGDLFKTQVWTLAKHLGVPKDIVSKPPSADLMPGQTDEGDMGISYQKAEEIASAASGLQLSVNIAQLMYGATGIAAAVGLAMRKRWSVRATIASCVAMTYTGSVASFAYSDPGFTQGGTITGVVSAFLSLV